MEESVREGALGVAMCSLHVHLFPLHFSVILKMKTHHGCFIGWLRSK